MKEIILTIDDSPSEFFEELLKYLIKNKFKAILFINGNKIRKHNKLLLIKAIISGCLIGNHAYSHKSFFFLKFPKAKQEILKTDKLIEELYTEAEISRPLKIFRFPHYREGGLNKYRLQKFLRDLGYTNPYYTKNIFQKIVCRKKHFYYHFFQRILRGNMMFIAI
jgi:peptidoglycan/xylan/chitin deacetylase (PgdA/CDA1 family)